MGAEREARMRLQDEITSQAREEAVFIKVCMLLATGVCGLNLLATSVCGLNLLATSA
jgi:hypothetical protein